eukprot:344511-Pelagomonas_calceolata.AAC.1
MGAAFTSKLEGQPSTNKEAQKLAVCSHLKLEIVLSPPVLLPLYSQVDGVVHLSKLSHLHLNELKAGGMASGLHVSGSRRFLQRGMGMLMALGAHMLQEAVAAYVAGDMVELV